MRTALVSLSALLCASAFAQGASFYAQNSTPVSHNCGGGGLGNSISATLYCSGGNLTPGAAVSVADGQSRIPQIFRLTGIAVKSDAPYMWAISLMTVRPTDPAFPQQSPQHSVEYIWVLPGKVDVLLGTDDLAKVNLNVFIEGSGASGPGYPCAAMLDPATGQLSRC